MRRVSPLAARRGSAAPWAVALRGPDRPYTGYSTQQPSFLLCWRVSPVLQRDEIGYYVPEICTHLVSAPARRGAPAIVYCSLASFISLGSEHEGRLSIRQPAGIVHSYTPAELSYPEGRSVTRRTVSCTELRSGSGCRLARPARPRRGPPSYEGTSDSSVGCRSTRQTVTCKAT